MIWAAASTRGVTRRAVSIAIAAALVGGLGFVPAVSPATVAAQDTVGNWADVELSPPVVGQQFAAPSYTVDSGLWDCLPASITMAMSALQSTTLAQASGNGTTINVKDGSRFKAGETVVVGDEHMLIGKIYANSALTGDGLSMAPDGTWDVDVTRGADGTTVALHPAGALVQRPADFKSVREFMRKAAGVPVTGLGEDYGVVKQETDGLFAADDGYRKTSANGWRDVLETELSAGRPIVLYIVNSTLLNDSTGKAPRPDNEDFSGPHSVLAVGLVDNGQTVVVDDPWNRTYEDPGRNFKMTADDFVTAWGDKNSGWSYLGFEQTSTTDAPVQPVQPVQPAPPAAKPGGTWISPASGSDQFGSIHMAVHAYPPKGGAAIDHVNFTIWWPALGSKSGKWKTVCAVNSPTSGDEYDCDFDPLDLGVPPGQLWLSFDVYDKAGGINLASNGERSVNIPGEKDVVGSDWQTYQGDGYVVDYPDTPRTQSVTSSETYSIYSATASYCTVGDDSDPQVEYMVEHFRFASSIAASGYDYQALLDAILPASYTSNGSTITHRDAVIDGHSGQLFTESGDGVEGEFEVLAIGTDMYLVFAAHHSTDTTLDTQTFFNSFHVN